MIKVERAEKILAGFKKKKVLVIGDLMLDRYISGSVDRISPEAPVPVVCVASEYSRPGGAANVALNIQSLGGQAVLAGVVGNDSDGEELISILKDAGIRTDGVIKGAGVRTTVKTRILAERQQVVRVDHEGGCVDGRTMEGFCEKIENLIGHIDGVVIEDYGKGMITQKVLDAAINAASTGDVPVGLDPKYGHDLKVRGLTLTTPNYKEACSAAGLPEIRLGDNPKKNPNVLKAGKFLMNEWGAKIALITLGAQGMCMMAKGREPEFIPTRAREVFDVSGAGDTVIATALTALVAGADCSEAALLANYAAGVVVGRLGTATCSSADLVNSIKNG